VAHDTDVAIGWGVLKPMCEQRRTPAPFDLANTHLPRKLGNSMNVSHHPSRAGRCVRALALTSVLALGATGCSGGSGGGSSSTSVDTKKASAALKDGLKAHSSGDLKVAEADYNKTLKYDPNNKFAFYNLALIDASNGNYGVAEKHYRAALKADAKYEPALFNLAILRTARKDPSEAISLYKRAVAVNKKDAAAWLNLGLLLREDGQTKAGNTAVLRAIGLNPKLKDPKPPVTPKTKAKAPSAG